LEKKKKSNGLLVTGGNSTLSEKCLLKGIEAAAIVFRQP
jgi:hypothetical protein